MQLISLVYPMDFPMNFPIQPLFKMYHRSECIILSKENYDIALFYSPKIDVGFINLWNQMNCKCKNLSFTQFHLV